MALIGCSGKTKLRHGKFEILGLRLRRQMYSFCLLHGWLAGPSPGKTGSGGRTNERGEVAYAALTSREARIGAHQVWVSAYVYGEEHQGGGDVSRVHASLEEKPS